MHYYNVCLFNYTARDLQKVTEETIEVTDWQALGIALHVQHYTIVRIKNGNEGPLGCQRKMFMAWIDSGKATWNGLCDALRSSTVNKVGVANAIEQKYLK